MQIKTYCNHCKEFFIANTRRAVYCSDKCRIAAWRQRKKSFIWQAIQAVNKAKSEISNNDNPCPVCQQRANITNCLLSLCLSCHI